MGVCLNFRSAGPVEPGVAAAIRRARGRGLGDQPWVLCEPPHFHRDPDEDGRLVGSSKLNLMPDAEELAEAGGRRDDLDRLLEILCGLSQKHGVNWDLDIDGHELGSIVEGVCDEQVRGALEAFAALADDLTEGLGLDDLDVDSEGNEPRGDAPGPRLWRGPED
jgi:hypothetical protein